METRVRTSISQKILFQLSILLNQTNAHTVYTIVHFTNAQTCLGDIAPQFVFQK